MDRLEGTNQGIPIVPGNSDNNSSKISSSKSLAHLAPFLVKISRAASDSDAIELGAIRSAFLNCDNQRFCFIHLYHDASDAVHAKVINSRFETKEHPSEGHILVLDKQRKKILMDENARDYYKNRMHEVFEQAYGGCDLEDQEILGLLLQDFTDQLVKREEELEDKGKTRSKSRAGSRSTGSKHNISEASQQRQEAIKEEIAEASDEMISRAEYSHRMTQVQMLSKEESNRYRRDEEIQEDAKVTNERHQADLEIKKQGLEDQPGTSPGRKDWELLWVEALNKIA